MNMLHEMSEETDAVDDLSTLAWVHEELRRSLESAHKSLRRYLKEAEAVEDRVGFMLAVLDIQRRAVAAA